MAHDFFISYSSKDKATADAACAVLESRGIRCWTAPRDILPSDEWGGAIIRAIGGAKVFLLVFSESANRSPQIRREVERAVNRGIPVVPMRIEDVAPVDTLEYFISAAHWLDAFTPPIERHLNYLADVVDRILVGPQDSSSPPIRPAPRAPATSSRGRLPTREQYLLMLVGMGVLAVVIAAIWFFRAPGADAFGRTPRQTVEAFYRALGNADGMQASQLMVPEKRVLRNYIPINVTDYYTSLKSPLVVTLVAEAGATAFTVNYRYRNKTGKACVGHALVFTAQRDGQWMISRIEAPLDICA